MNIFEILDREAKARGLSFLVIGGHAVNQHGYSRFTKDLDLFIRRSDSAQWLSILKQHGFSLFRDGGNFLQLSAPENCRWPVDFMLVPDATFAEMQAASIPAQFGEIVLQIPSLDHLFALKLHALKYGPEDRKYKDLTDILSLSGIHSVDLRGDKFRFLCEKYGDIKIYETILNFGL